MIFEPFRCREARECGLKRTLPREARHPAAPYEGATGVDSVTWRTGEQRLQAGGRNGVLSVHFIPPGLAGLGPLWDRRGG